MEPRLFHCLIAISSLWSPHGIILDAGCNDGRSSVLLAQHFPNRSVVAMEPIRLNVHLARARAMKAFNSSDGARLTVLQGGLGAKVGSATYAATLDHQRIRNIGGGSGIQTGTAPGYAYQQNFTARASFDVWTVDALLHSRGQHLSFAHWDVEGGEVDVLDGARRTIARDQPMFTLEAFPRSSPQAFVEMARRVYALGYRMLEIPESCGAPSDCRNFVCLPSALWGQLASIPDCKGTEAQHFS